MIDPTKPYAKLSVDGDIVTKKTTTTSTTTNHHASTNRDACETTLTKNKLIATGGGRVINTKRKKLPMSKENIDH